MKKSYKILLVIILIIVGLWSINYVIEDHSKYSRFRYFVDIQLFNESSFEVIVPFPIDMKHNDNPSIKIFNQLETIKGNSSFQVIDSEKGNGLMIDSNRNISLLSEGKLKFDNNIPSFLSMQIPNEYGKLEENGLSSYWIHSNNNLSFSISYYFEELYRPNLIVEINISGQTLMGWQMISGYIFSEVE